MYGLYCTTDWEVFLLRANARPPARPPALSKRARAPARLGARPRARPRAHAPAPTPPAARLPARAPARAPARPPARVLARYLNAKQLRELAYHKGVVATGSMGKLEVIQTMLLPDAFADEKATCA